MRGRKLVLLWSGIIIFGCLVTLYIGHCTGVWGENDYLPHYFFQCACPRSMENIRIQKLYSEHAEVMFSACDDIGPIPSPSGQKVAVIDFNNPNGSYVWFLQTDKRVPFTWLEGDLAWLSDDLLFVYRGVGINVVDLDTGAEVPITVRDDVCLDNGEIAPSVISALQEANHVILDHTTVAAISSDALASSEHSFVIPYDEFDYILADSKSPAESQERMRQFLQDQDIDYLDYIGRRGTDVLSLHGAEMDLVSPDGRFFYRTGGYEDGIYLVETGEKIVDEIHSWIPVGWVYDGVIVQPIGSDYLFYILYDIAGASLCEIRDPWLKLQVPAEYTVSDTNPD